MGYSNHIYVYYSKYIKYAEYMFIPYSVYLYIYIYIYTYIFVYTPDIQYCGNETLSTESIHFGGVHMGVFHLVWGWDYDLAEIRKYVTDLNSSAIVLGMISL